MEGRGLGLLVTRAVIGLRGEAVMDERDDDDDDDVADDDDGACLAAAAMVDVIGLNAALSVSPLANADRSSPRFAAR